MPPIPADPAGESADRNQRRVLPDASADKKVPVPAAEDMLQK
jgi:hypothetical protein